jgi:hypothetical protein
VISKKPRPKKCQNKECGRLFTPDRPFKKGCCISCEVVIGLAAVKKSKAAKALKERKAIKLKLEQLKTRADWLRETQVEFNKYIRERDRLAGYKCISSGKPLDWSGNNVDAGHYRSTGSAPHLRFDERNCHAQSKHDNRYLSGNAVDYRLGLIARIGLAEVDALEADQTPKKYSIEDLKQIKSTYVQKLKDLKNGN